MQNGGNKIRNLFVHQEITKVTPANNLKSDSPYCDMYVKKQN